MSKALIKNLKAIANNSENVQIIELCDLAVRALADLEALRKESEQWDKTSLVEIIKERDTMRKERDAAYDRAIYVLEEMRICPFDSRLSVPWEAEFVKAIKGIRELKDKP